MKPRRILLIGPECTGKTWLAAELVKQYGVQRFRRTDGKLMMLGKDVDFGVAPSAVHGWSRKDFAAIFFLKKLARHFDRYLGRGPKGEKELTSMRSRREIRR